MGRMDPSRHVVPRRGRVAGTGVMTHTPTCGTREGVTRRKRPRWANARVSKSQPEAERMTADDEGDDSSRLLSRQGPDLQDGGASSETRDHIFASRDENPVYWPPAAAGRRADTRELRDDDDISEVERSPPPFQWYLPVGEASAAPPFRADVANGGSGHLSRQPRGGSRGGAAVAVGAIAARRRVGSRAAPSDPAREGPAPVTDAAPTLPDASARWERRLAAFLRFGGASELSRDLAGGSQVWFSPV